MEDSIWYTSHTPVYSISSFILRRSRCRPLTSVGFQPYHVDCNKYDTIELDAYGLGIAGGRTIGRGRGGYVMYFVVAHMIRRRYVRRSSTMDTFRRRRLFDGVYEYVCISFQSTIDDGGRD